MIAPQLVFTAIVTGKPLELPPEGEDMLIAIILKMLRDEAVLNAEYVGDVLDAEEVG